jgi:signal transduction histidine kinase
VSAAVALSGWMTAALAGILAATTARSAGARMEAAARACHELRGPITAARLGIELGVRAGELSPARLRAIELELASATVALDDLAGADPTRARLTEDVDVGELLQDTVEGWRAAAGARGARLSLRWTGPGATARGDRIRLAQAIGNLIANAAEHGGGVIEIRGRGDGDGVRIEVTDEGTGLPAPVASLAARARGGRGSRGRGLAIASSIAVEHGGRLAAAPSEHGARLVLELPAAPAALRSHTS